MKRECERCEGGGMIASDEQGAPWLAWESLPVRSYAVVIRDGLARPILCPECHGTGEVEVED